MAEKVYEFGPAARARPGPAAPTQPSLVRRLEAMRDSELTETSDPEADRVPVGRPSAAISPEIAEICTKECRSRRELSNAYFLANFRFDTAENEPSGARTTGEDLGARLGPPPPAARASPRPRERPPPTPPMAP